MKRTLIVLCAFSLVVLMAMPVQAEVQNIKISGGIAIRGIFRDNFTPANSGAARALGTFAEIGSADYYNQITHLNVDVDLTDNVSASIKLLNERDWGVGAATIISPSAYITVKEMLYSPLTIKAGRMPVVVADGLLIGDGTMTEGLTASEFSVQNEFDAVVAVLDYDPLTLIVGTLKLQEGIAPNAVGTADGDIDGYLLDAIYKFEDYDATLDTYLVMAHYSTPGSLATVPPTQLFNGPAANSTVSTDVWALATNLKMVPIEALTADLGIAIQGGDYMKRTGAVAPAVNSRDLSAMAFNLGVNYAFDNEYSPTLGAKYLYRSGDNGAGTGKFKGWLPLAEGQMHSIIVDPNTNTNSFGLNASLVPADRLTLGLDIWFFNLAKAQAAATVVPGTTTQVTTTKKAVGTELDISLNYAYTEDVNIGLVVAYFDPGNFYANGFDKTAKEAMLSMAVKF